LRGEESSVSERLIEEGVIGFRKVERGGVIGTRTVERGEVISTRKVDRGGVHRYQKG
jgi:hypothetical protein